MNGAWPTDRPSAEQLDVGRDYVLGLRRVAAGVEYVVRYVLRKGG